LSKTIEIEIENGKCFLELKLNELGSCLKFKKPLAINWSDCHGSIAQFYAIFSYSQEYKESINISLKSKMNNGEFLLDSEIYEIEKLLNLFENGTYNVSYEPKYKFEISDSWNWNLAKNYKLFTSNPTIRTETLQYYSDDKCNLNYLSESYYDGYSEYFIFTQPSEILKEERIKFYESEIRKGIKPIALIYSGYSQTKGTYDDGSNWMGTYNSGKFILDGHHKLVAYKNMNITPALIRIEKIYKSDAELNLSIEDFKNDLENKLMKCQVKHFIEKYKER